MPDLTGSLSHYTRANVAFEFIVPNLTLQMSAYPNMRDPYENRELPFMGSSRRGEEDPPGSNATLELMWKVQDSIERVRNRTLLLSFTRDAQEGYRNTDRPFNYGWARPRMWEQYADNHAGVCIVFDRDRTVGGITAELHRIGSPSSGDVIYSARGFPDTPSATIHLDQFRDDYHQSIGAFVANNQHDLFFTKTLDWQTEYEFRITVFPNEPALGGYQLVSFGGAESIRAVILGEKFPAWQVPGAKAVCDRHKIKLLTMTWLAAGHGRPSSTEDCGRVPSLRLSLPA
jgi:hypothetical protein